MNVFGKFLILAGLLFAYAPGQMLVAGIEDVLKNLDECIKQDTLPTGATINPSGNLLIPDYDGRRFSPDGVFGRLGTWFRNPQYMIAVRLVAGGKCGLVFERPWNKTEANDPECVDKNWTKSRENLSSDQVKTIKELARSNGLVPDGRCDKAWGWNEAPAHRESSDEIAPKPELVIHDPASQDVPGLPEAQVSVSKNDASNMSVVPAGHREHAKNLSKKKPEKRRHLRSHVEISQNLSKPAPKTPRKKRVSKQRKNPMLDQIRTNQKNQKKKDQSAWLDGFTPEKEKAVMKELASIHCPESDVSKIVDNSVSKSVQIDSDSEKPPVQTTKADDAKSHEDADETDKPSSDSDKPGSKASLISTIALVGGGVGTVSVIALWFKIYNEEFSKAIQDECSCPKKVARQRASRRLLGCWKDIKNNKALCVSEVIAVIGLIGGTLGKVLA